MPKPFEVLEPDAFFSEFPKLPRDLKPASKATGDYICFSLAVGDTRRVWAPESHCWWLPRIPRSRSTSSFVKLFSALGYEKCNDGAYERGVRKIAIFAIGGNVKHVAVQPPDKGGLWHSKMGTNVNIMHTIDQVSKTATKNGYGEVVRFMRERKPSPAKRIRGTATLA